MIRKKVLSVFSAIACLLGVLFVGITGAQAASIPVYDLKNTQITGLYGNLRIDTTHTSPEDVTVINGFNIVPFQYGQGPCASTVYQPDQTGASLKVANVGTWIDPQGNSHQIDMTVTVNGYVQPADFRIMYSSCSSSTDLKTLTGFGPTAGTAGVYPSDNQRPSIDFTVKLTRADGGSVDGIMGVTGFQDIDGKPDHATQPNEGWELLSGFDGVYVRSDAHLMEFGDNGWAGYIDEDQDPDQENTHGKQHYLGATFSGDTFRVRYSVMPGDSRGSQLLPLNSTILYPLTYDLNDGQGKTPNE